MSNVHPTSTGGSGRIQPRRSTYKPGDRRVELLKCAQCGFPFRVGIDSEGDSIENAPSDTAVITTVNNTAASLPQHLKTNAVFLVSSVTTYDVSSTTGCRMCHSLNPRGIGRNADFDTAKGSMEGR